MSDNPLTSNKESKQNSHNVRIVYDPSELGYDFGPDHPLKPARVKALVELLESSGLWHLDQAETLLKPVAATLEQLKLVHTPDYIAAVQRLSSMVGHENTKEEHDEHTRLAMHYGFGDGDTPA